MASTSFSTVSTTKAPQKARIRSIPVTHTLRNLVDPPHAKRPIYSYDVLAQAAITGSPTKRLTLKGLYRAIEDRFPYYANLKTKSWKDSLKHVLSYKLAFKNIGRPIQERGRGVYWTFVDVKGYKRERRRGSNQNVQRVGTARMPTTAPSQLVPLVRPVPPPQVPGSDNFVFMPISSVVSPPVVLDTEQAPSQTHGHHFVRPKYRSRFLLQDEHEGQDNRFTLRPCYTSESYSEAPRSQRVTGICPAPVPLQPQDQTNQLGHINVTQVRGFAPVTSSLNAPSRATSSALFPSWGMRNIPSVETVRNMVPAMIPVDEGRT